MLGNVLAFDSPKGTNGGGIIGSSGFVGVPYNFLAQTLTIPTNYQYIVKQQLSLDATSILRIQGQVIIL